MLVTNKNVDLFQIYKLHADYFFANTESRVDLIVGSRDLSKPVWDIEVGLVKKDVMWMFSKKSDPKTIQLVEEAQFESRFVFRWIPEKRGYYQMPRLQIESTFPFRMLRAWKYYDEDTEFYVFPERKGIDQIPLRSGNQSEKEAEAQSKNEGLFRDFREYQKSDPPQRIDWKRSLKHQKHLVKNFESSGDRKIFLDWEMTNFLNDFEARVSQLAKWVDICFQKGDAFSLKIGEFETGLGTQIQHYKTCMQKLALLKEEEMNGQ